MAGRPGRALLAGTFLLAACGGRGGTPPDVPPVVRGPDGKPYRLVVKGPYAAYYDPWGQLDRIERDSNGDGKPDQIAHYDGAKTAHLLEVDEDFDGRIDRWEDYDAAGKLLKVGVSRRGRGPDLWTVPGPSGVPWRKEYDEDGDGKVDRIEILEAGRVVRVEIDGNRDGRIDRWQEWRNGRLVAEDLDTDGDGKPDRRLRYGAAGQVVGLEPLAHD